MPDRGAGEGIHNVGNVVFQADTLQASDHVLQLFVRQFVVDLGTFRTR